MLISGTLEVSFRGETSFVSLGGRTTRKFRGGNRGGVGTGSSTEEGKQRDVGKMPRPPVLPSRPVAGSGSEESTCINGPSVSELKSSDFTNLSYDISKGSILLPQESMSLPTTPRPVSSNSLLCQWLGT